VITEKLPTVVLIVYQNVKQKYIIEPEKSVMKVLLKSRGAKSELIAEVEVPPLKPMPEVMIWGSRVFTRCSYEEPHVYYEVTAYVCKSEQEKSWGEMTLEDLLTSGG
jgi:hypothetical protein